MRDLLLVLLLICTVASQKSYEKITDVSNCRCNKEYQPLEDPETGYYCSGKTLKIIQPCNMIHRPKCVCTNATGVLTDQEGTWCTIYSGGRLIKKWDCENDGEWKSFHDQPAGEEPKD